MVTAFYAAICALLLVKLSLNVVKLRRQLKVRIGDGDNPQLQVAIRTHANATEYMPITLILLALLELNQAPLWLLHIAGITLLAGRIIHATALVSDNLTRRIVSMRLTFYLIIGLAAANLYYLPYRHFVGLD